MYIVLDLVDAPIEHSPRNILTSQKLLAFPLEGDIRVEDATLPFRHVCELIDQCQHCQFALGVTEFGVFGAI